MALHRILVVDDSPAIRETIGILLGGDYQVEALEVGEFLARGRGVVQETTLIIAADRRELREAGRTWPHPAPILWLIDAAPAMASDAEAVLPRRFSPHELRRRVRELLECPPGAPPRHAENLWLTEPCLPAAAASVVAEALSNDLPLHLCGEAGTGKRRIARAVHAARGGGALLAIPGAAFDSHPLEAAKARYGTLFVGDVEALSAEGQQRLLGLLLPSGLAHIPGGERLRLITAASSELGALVDERRFAPELYYRLTTLNARLLPMRERVDDMPAIAGRIAAELARALGLEPVTFTPAAVERLRRYLWFGNLAELEAVLARTLSIRRRERVDADDLLFEQTPLRSAPRAPADAVRNGSGQHGVDALDLVINELAHEFKNPLVTIKTFAQHLRRVLHSGADEEQFARLTGEAVDQIDQVLENLLQFTRFQAADLRPVSLRSILQPVLEEQQRALAERAIELEIAPFDDTCVSADPEQVAYAWSNLLRSVSRDLSPRQRLVVRCPAPETIELVLPEEADPMGSHLATLLDGKANGGGALPLGVALATAVLERNGAAVTLARATQPNTVTVRFTRAAAEKIVVDGGNGETARTGG